MFRLCDVEGFFFWHVKLVAYALGHLSVLIQKLECCYAGVLAEQVYKL